ncbi:MAG: pyruvate dehydrogenase (acetyl-transferring) E1 component subunit alpha [Chloracidobacterium sp.]|nr:pyruvate dehydrogenase (acetyl-transferring) E1 component subunit alpha [Chloracidobacterium sp.]
MSEFSVLKTEQIGRAAGENIELLGQILLIRRFEEKCVELYSAGKIRGFLHLYIGEEAVGVGTMSALKDEDRIVSTYREHGHALARGIPAGSIMAEMFGKANGCCRGRGGSMHLFDRTKNFFGGNAIVGGGLPLAVGLAIADKMQNTNAITVCFFGDGAVAEGEFHESLNLASLWELPVLFICENNLYAMGTALDRHQAQTDIAKKAGSYAMPSETVNGMDVLGVRDASMRAAELVRSESKPFLLVAETYRFRAHSMYDPDLYRTKDEVEQWKLRCPIANFQKYLLQTGEADAATFEALEKKVEKEISEAVDFADAGEIESVEDLCKDVYTPFQALTSQGE